MTVGGARTTSRADAAIALRGILARLVPARTDPGTDAARPVAALGGFTVTAAVQSPRFEPYLVLTLADVPRSAIRVEYDELRDTRPLGIVTRLENRVGDLDYTRSRVSAEHTRATDELERARAAIGAPFTHHQALESARARSIQLTGELAARDQNPMPERGRHPGHAAATSTGPSAAGNPAAADAAAASPAAAPAPPPQLSPPPPPPPPPPPGPSRGR